MEHEFACYRCGASLDGLSLPLSRRDQCPDCAADLHVCRMCRHYAPAVPRQCREDGAEDVTNKTTANFCDWFDPAGGRYDAAAAADAGRARAALGALFGEGEAPAADDDAARTEAEKLFR